MFHDGRRCALRPFLLVALLACGGTVGARAGSETSPETATGEHFTVSATGSVYTVHRDPDTGVKWMTGPDGRRCDGVEEAVLREEATLPADLRYLHGELVDRAVAGGEDPVRIVLVPRDQPLGSVAREERDAMLPAVSEDLRRSRELLGSIAAEREANESRLSVPDRVEEERRLLSTTEREELAQLRERMLAAVRAARGRAVQRAVDASEAALAPLREALSTLAGAHEVAVSRTFVTLTADVPAASLRRLSVMSRGNWSVLPHRTSTVSLDVSRATIGAGTWSANGYDGSSSTVVAVLDTGMDSAHPALSSVITGEAVFLQAGQYASYFADNASSTDDYHGHGSHVGGIVMSSDSTYTGVAPGGALLNAKCGYLWVYAGYGYGGLEDADIMAAGDWAVGQGADALNGSFGGGGTTNGSSALSLFFDALVDDLGVSTAIAAGNSGPGSGTVGTPGDGFNLVTVGSFDDRGTTSRSDDRLSSFSSRGPLDDGRSKPDFSAPGSSITSCNADWESASDWVAFDGTSMATPHVAGSMALLYDYGASWSPYALKALLANTTLNTNLRDHNGNAITGRNTWGTGGLDLATAFTERASVLERTVNSAGSPVVFVRTGSLSSGDRATLCWGRSVTSNGTSAPTSYRSLVDLDLYVYEESTGALQGSSTAYLESVEQVSVPSAVSSPILKVDRASSFPSGQSSQVFAVAAGSSSASTVVGAPSPKCSFTDDTEAAVGKWGEMLVGVKVQNIGGLPAFAPSVTLAVPAGWTVVAGDNPRTLPTLQGGGGTVTVGWTVRADDAATALRTLSASASSAGYGETFVGEGDSRTVAHDTVAPTGFVFIEGGADAVPTGEVDLQVIGQDDSSGVARMRLRNEGDAWGAWEDYRSSVTWTLGDGEGDRTVEVQFEDRVGNVSGTITGSILVDGSPPTLSVQVVGDVPYVMPWESVSLSTDAEDAGSGVDGFRSRWEGGSWSPWIDAAEEFIVLRDSAAPGSDLLVQARDGAGNVSSAVVVALELVPEVPADLTVMTSRSGSLPSSVDVDALGLHLLQGDLLTVTVKARPRVRKADAGVALDLHGPDHLLHVSGRFPAGGRKPGIRSFPVQADGHHWLVLRGEGAAAGVGVDYVLKAKVKRPRSTARPSGSTVNVDGEAAIVFEAARGDVLTGVLKGDVLSAVLEDPDGVTYPVALKIAGSGRSAKVLPVRLEGGTGAWTLRVEAVTDLSWKLKRKASRDGPSSE